MRTPAIAGYWYPDDPKTLDGLLAVWTSSEAPLAPPPAILLVPHAGYAYSGQLAAAAYSRLPAQSYDQILLLAPSHHAALLGQVSVEPAGEVATPLGPVVFDGTLHKALRRLPGAVCLASAHAREHSLDIQLPLIRRFLPGCALGGLLVGQLSLHAPGGRERLVALAEALRALLTPRTLVIISTDFTHYGTRFGYVPFDNDIENNLRTLDDTVFQAFASGDPWRFDAVIRQTRATVCGASAMLLALMCLPDGAVFTRLAYTTSGRLTGSWNQSVSYLSAAVHADWQQPAKALGDPELSEEPASPQDNNALSAAAGNELLQLTRKSVQAAVMQEPAPDPEIELSPAVLHELSACRGAFVTLNRHGQLRGCIGEIAPIRPLCRVVVDRARSAALEDPRFYPVSPAELDALEIEVSVLTTPEPVTSPDKILPGKHGVILQKRGRAAVFLPQVATEQGWDRDTMLTQLARKAGLAPDDWREGASFMVFTAQILR